MMMPFEWDVRVSSKDHTVTAPTFHANEPATASYTTLRGTTLRKSVERRGSGLSCTSGTYGQTDRYLEVLAFAPSTSCH